MKLLLITLTVLQSLFAALEQKTLQSDFTITMADSPSSTSAMTYSGTLAMHGKQFALEMFGMEAAYDGSTLYMYSADLNELTLSTPSLEELTQTNPFLYAQALLPICQHDEQTVGDLTQITLTPHDPAAGISKFVLRVANSTLLPLSAEIHEADGNTTTLRLTQAQYTYTAPAFTIEKADAYINDLR